MIIYSNICKARSQSFKTAMQSRSASKAITQSSIEVYSNTHVQFQIRTTFVSVVASLVHLWVFYLSAKEGKRKVSLFGGDIFFDVEIYNGKPILQYGWRLPLFLLRRNRPRFSRLGTDTRRDFVPFVFNPVGPFSQESVLHNPQQRFETVFRLSRQEKTAKTSTDYPSKETSLATKKMASKSLKNRYACFAISKA